jgi:hypothetical protein
MQLFGVHIAVCACFVQIDACLNECLLFRGPYADDDKCVKCGEYRYAEDTEAHKRAQLLLGVEIDENASLSQKKQTYTARYTYRYCPVIPRLKSLIAHAVMSGIFPYADDNMYNPDKNIADDIHQAPIYHRFARHFPLKRQDPVNGVCDIRVALGIGADRASMSKHKQRNDYAVLPILLSIINWPIWFRTKEKHLLLVGLPPLKSHNPKIFFGKYLINIMTPITPSLTQPHSHMHAHTHTHTHTHTHSQRMQRYS